MEDDFTDMVEELQSQPVVLELNNNFVDFEEVVQRDDMGTSIQQVNEEEHVVRCLILKRMILEPPVSHQLT